MKIAISADSTLALSQKEAQAFGIFVMPLNVIVNGQEYHDDIDISKEELEKFMRENRRISTSTPTPFEIEQYFDKILKKVLNRSFTSQFHGNSPRCLISLQECVQSFMVIKY